MKNSDSNSNRERDDKMRKSNNHKNAGMKKSDKKKSTHPSFNLPFSFSLSLPKTTTKLESDDGVKKPKSLEITLRNDNQSFDFVDGLSPPFWVEVVEEW